MRWVISLIATCFSVQLCLGTVINVPSGQPTIQAGIDVVSDGDTVLVAPGTYRENIILYGKNIKVLSSSGSDSTILKGAVQFMYSEGPDAEFRGFTLDAGGIGFYIRIAYGSSPIIAQNVLTGYSGSDVAIKINNSNPTIKRNLFFNNQGIACVGIYSGTATVVNNTFANNNRGLFTLDNGVAKNNIIVNSVEYGISGGFSELNYNDVWNNYPDYDGGASAGANSICLDPLFSDSQNRDYSLLFGSPCIDAGDPDPEYNDLDGTRNDIGAIPYEYAGPAVANINMGSEYLQHVINHTPTVYWQFEDTSGIQTAYSIEVGVDVSWPDADMWVSGDVYSADTFAVYAGTPLEDGVTYFLRVRVCSGTFWSDYEETAFTMNGRPTVPSLTAPIGQLITIIDLTRLAVVNSSDTQGDELTYDFELYGDEFLTDLLDSDYDVLEHEAYTFSRAFKGLAANTGYWWRSRVFDGYEHSDWSDSGSFYLSDPADTLRVPSEYNTIQSAVQSSTEGDLILVDDGVFSGEGNRDILISGKSVMIQSRNGPEHTTIDCNGSHAEPRRAFRIKNEHLSLSVISGFTVQNGYGLYVIEWPDYLEGNVGGAIYATDAALVLLNCSFDDNGADHRGGAVYASDSELILVGCDFEGNTCDLGPGGAVCCMASNLDATTSSFTENYSGWIGGAVYIGNWTYPERERLFLNKTSFARNVGVEGGGAVAAGVGLRSLAELTNCTFVSNETGSSYGHLDVYGNMSVANCIFAYNGGFAPITHRVYHLRQIDCTNMFGNLGGDWNGLGVWHGINGNISEAPRFLDTSGVDLRLFSTSPCAPENNDCGELIGAYEVGYENRAYVVAPDGDDITGNGTDADPFASVHKALDEARHWDSIVVLDGHYYERLDFGGKRLCLASEFLRDSDTSHINATVIDGDSSVSGPSDTGSVVCFDSGEDSNSILLGLTVQNGSGTVVTDGSLAGSTIGGGILVIESGPLIDHCIVRDCRADYGGGVVCSNIGWTGLMNTSFEDNTAVYGGGLACVESANVTVMACSFTGNNAHHGGAASISESGKLLTKWCDFDSNTARQGGGVFCDSGSIEIRNTGICNSTRGGGIYLNQAGGNFVSCLIADNAGSGIVAIMGTAVSKNCTVVRNHAFRGAAVICSLSTVSLEHTIVAFNTGGEGLYIDESSPLFGLYCSNLYGNEGGDWVGPIEDFSGILGNFSLDPLFCDTAAADYHIAANSPCAPEFSSCGSLTGALGVGCSAIFLCGDADGNQEIDIDDAVYLLDYVFGNGAAPVPPEAGDADCSGAIDIDDIVYLVNYIFSGGNVPCDTDGDEVPDC
jgi:predicted outer membrane repeat protein